MTQLQTSAELLDHALFQAHEKTDGTSDYETVAVTWLNWAYRAIWMGGNEFVSNRNPLWWWLRAEAPLILQPVIETGSVSVTNNSASATLSATQATSLAGRHFKVDSHADVFKISAHTAGTDALTLDSVYTGDTESGASYKAMLLEYDLASDLLYLISPMRAYGTGRRVYGLSLRDLDERYPLDTIASGRPQHFAHVDEDTIRFSHYGGDSSSELFRLDYDYLKRPSDLADDENEPLIPLRYRYVLADMVTMKILLDRDEFQLSEGVALQVRSTIAAMLSEHRARLGRLGQQGRIFPRESQREKHRLPLRTSSGHIIG